MKIVISTRYRKDYRYWSESNPGITKKIDELFDAIGADPFGGIGKPEPLRHNLSGCWSRRINREHRVVYQVDAETITFLSCRYHY